MAVTAKKIIRGTAVETGTQTTVDEQIEFSGNNTHSGDNDFTSGTQSFGTGKLKKNSEDVPNESETIVLAQAEAIKQAIIFG